jgi:hypothetical protein
LYTPVCMYPDVVFVHTCMYVSGCGFCTHLYVCIRMWFLYTPVCIYPDVVFVHTWMYPDVVLVHTCMYPDVVFVS